MWTARCDKAASALSDSVTGAPDLSEGLGAVLNSEFLAEEEEEEEDGGESVLVEEEEEEEEVEAEVARTLVVELEVDRVATYGFLRTADAFALSTLLVSIPIEGVSRTGKLEAASLPCSFIEGVALALLLLLLFTAITGGGLPGDATGVFSTLDKTEADADEEEDDEEDEEDEESFLSVLASAPSTHLKAIAMTNKHIRRRTDIVFVIFVVVRLSTAGKNAPVLLLVTITY